MQPLQGKQWWWIEAPNEVRRRLYVTKTDFEKELHNCPKHTRYGSIEGNNIITLGETGMYPEELYNPINHPKHYTSHPSGIECIDITRHMNFNLGNAIKYIWRADNKNGLEDLKKARWYINDEIKRLSQ